MRRAGFLLCVLFASVAIHADELLHSIAPAFGPAAGGTTVTLRGDFGDWPYGVIFGTTPAASTTKIDNHTLVAVTPPHLPGVVPVVLFQYDIGVGTDQTFEFTSSDDDPFAGYLLPILAPPVHGAFGSEFVTQLTAGNPSSKDLSVFGLGPECAQTDCAVDLLNVPYIIPTGTTMPDMFNRIEHDAPAGRIIYVPKDQEADIALNLRVADITRSALNFGTEIPVVALDEFSGRVVLTGVPADARFRNTLRIYSRDGDALVRISFRGEDHYVQLTGSNGPFTPAYAVFSDFPTSGEPYTIVLENQDPCENCSPSQPARHIWAFMSITNNDTQTITTITPQR